MTTLLAIDPGQATGWSLWFPNVTRPFELVTWGVVTGGASGFIHSDQMVSLIREADIVVCEKFILDGRASDSPVDIVPKDIEGMVRALCLHARGDRPVEPRYQDKALKATVPDAVVKRAGYWVENSQVDHEDARDVNDSIIHALIYAREIEHEPTLQRLYPE